MTIFNSEYNLVCFNLSINCQKILLIHRGKAYNPFYGFVCSFFYYLILDTVATIFYPQKPIRGIPPALKSKNFLKFNSF